jgi:hypothetical protein
MSNNNLNSETLSALSSGQLRERTVALVLRASTIALSLGPMNLMRGAKGL